MYDSFSTIVDTLDSASLVVRAHTRMALWTQLPPRQPREHWLDRCNRAAFRSVVSNRKCNDCKTHVDKKVPSPVLEWDPNKWDNNLVYETSRRAVGGSHKPVCGCARCWSRLLPPGVSGRPLRHNRIGPATRDDDTVARPHPA